LPPDTPPQGAVSTGDTYLSLFTLSPLLWFFVHFLFLALKQILFSFFFPMHVFPHRAPPHPPTGVLSVFIGSPLDWSCNHTRPCKPNLNSPAVIGDRLLRHFFDPFWAAMRPFFFEHLPRFLFSFGPPRGPRFLLPTVALPVAFKHFF